MLHTKFQAPEASGLKEILKYFFMYFYDWNLRPSGTGLLGPSFEQIWYWITMQCYMPKFQASQPCGSEDEAF